MCGEKLVTEFITRYMMGSPLRVRGKVGPVIQLRAGPGITPAYARKRPRSPTSSGVRRDHPRVCGEKLGTFTRSDALLGSPPRMRGKVLREVVHHAAERITPAYAGKRTRPRRWVRPPRDHPRVCGEKRIFIPFTNIKLGSPPRMRGKGNFHVVTHTKVGITPARAGKSVRRENSSS